MKGGNVEIGTLEFQSYFRKEFPTRKKSKTKLEKLAKQRQMSDQIGIQTI